MFRTARRWLAQTFAPPLECRVKRHSFKPELEVLDARDVPSVNYWRGTVDSNFDNYANWSLNVVPSAGDDIVFQPLVIYTDEGPVTSVVSCSGMHAPDGGGEYNSVTLEIGYSAVVGLAGGFSTGALWIADGSLDQGSPSSPWTDTDITVTGTEIVTYENQIILNSMPADFYWTGGTLNGTSHIATVIVTGNSTTGLIAPANAGTVGLGSNLTLDQGAVVTIGAGELDFLNDAMEININANCGVNVAPGQEGVTTMGGNVVQGDLTKIKSGGWYKVSDGTVTGDSIAIDNQGGTFTLEAASKLILGKTVPGAVRTCSFQSNGEEYIAADATLDVHPLSPQQQRGYYKTGGSIIIGCGDKPTSNFDGNIYGNVYIESGDISYDPYTRSGAEWGEFLVKGNVYWKAGTYSACVDATQNMSGDLWKVIDGYFTMNGAITTSVNITALNDELAPVTPPSNMTWDLFEASVASGGISTVHGINPGLTSGYSFDPDPANPKGWWHLKSN